MNARMNEWMADADRQYKKKRRTAMQETWLEQFYNEMDAEKRLDILNTNADKTVNASEIANHSAGKPEEVDAAFIKKLWVARYGKRKPKTDAFVGYLMQLKYIAESGANDIGGQKRKQAVEIITGLCLFDVEKRPEAEQEILLSEITHAFRKFIDVSRNGRGFTSIVFGMGQLSDEGVAKKIAEQISAIAFTAPHMLHMEKEFALLQEAAKRAFRAEYPNREHFLKKL